MSYLPSEAVDTGSEAPPMRGAAPPTPVVDVVCCDAVDVSALDAAARKVGAEVRVAGSFDGWLQTHKQAAESESATIADVVLLVGGAASVAAGRYVARAAAVAADSWIVAAPVDATVERVAEIANQGARGLLLLPAPAETIESTLGGMAAAAAAGQAGRRAAAAHRRGLTRLTTGEHDVLQHMLAGLANKQIAQKLGIGLRTVELRRSKIMRKLGAKSLAQLVSFVCAAGYDS